MLPYYAAAQVAMIALWYGCWPHLSALVVFIPAIVAGVHLAYLVLVLCVSVVIIFVMSQSQRKVHMSETNRRT